MNELIWNVDARKYSLAHPLVPSFAFSPLLSRFREYKLSSFHLKSNQISRIYLILLYGTCKNPERAGIKCKFVSWNMQKKTPWERKISEKFRQISSRVTLYERKFCRKCWPFSRGGNIIFVIHSHSLNVEMRATATCNIHLDLFHVSSLAINLTLLIKNHAKQQASARKYRITE